MENIIKRRENFYIQKNKCIYSCLISMLIYIQIMFFCESVYGLKPLIINVIYLIGSFIVMLLFISILKIYKADYYRDICIFYILIILYNINEFICRIYENGETTNILFKSGVVHTISIFLMSVICCKISLHLTKKQIHNKGILIFSCAITMLAYIEALFLSGEYILLIINIVTIYICYKVNVELKNFKFIIDKKINAMLLLIRMIIGICILNIIDIMLKNTASPIDIIISMTLFMGYWTSVMITIDNLLNRPYKMLFSDMYNQNKEMNELNKEVVKKNRELEFSQAVIKKKENMFKTFFTNVPIPLVIVSKNMRIIFSNIAFQEFIEEENIKNIINRKIFSIIKLRNDIYVNPEQVEGKHIISGTFLKNNETLYIDMEFVKILSSREERLIILNDVTSKVRISNLKTEMENNIFQERIKRDFLSNISHDLKTPINVIYSAAQITSIYAKNKNIEALKKYNLISKLNCISLIRLTNNLIDSSRIYSDYLSANLIIKNIVEIVEGTVMSLVEYAKSKDVDLVFDTDEEELFVNLDDEFMQRIMLNLISNAIKFSNEKGRIEVIIKDLDTKIRIIIRDNGIGMDQEFIDKAFSRYAMGRNNENRKEKGTGIGLFVVKKLVEKQNGEINIKSKINVGTEIAIEFNKENINGEQDELVKRNL